MKPNLNKLHNSIPNILPLPIAVILNNTYDTYISIYDVYTHIHTTELQFCPKYPACQCAYSSLFKPVWCIHAHYMHTHKNSYVYIHVCICMLQQLHLYTHTEGDRHTSLRVLPSSRASSASCATISSCWRRISCDSSSSELHSRWMRALLASSSRRRSSSCWSASCDGQTTQECQQKSGQGRQKRENGQVVMALD